MPNSYHDYNQSGPVSIDLSGNSGNAIVMVMYWVGVSVPESGSGYTFDATCYDRLGAPSTLSGGQGDGSSLGANGSPDPVPASIQGVMAFDHTGSSEFHFDIGYLSPLGDLRYDYSVVAFGIG